MNEKPFILDFDPNKHAVLEPRHEECPYKFHSRLLYAFYRETPQKIAQFKQLGAAVVEMECAGMVACSKFRKASFAQILFTADSLANMDNYDERDWGEKSHSAGLEIGSQILIRI